MKNFHFHRLAQWRRQRGLGTQVIDISEWIVFLAKKPHFQQRRNDWWSAQQLPSHWPAIKCLPLTTRYCLMFKIKFSFFYTSQGFFFLFCFSNTNFFQLRASATSSFRTFDSRVSIGFAETGFLSAWKDSESRRSCRGYQGVDVSERLSGAKSRLSEDFIN